jgi:hypothetical protein
VGVNPLTLPVRLAPAPSGFPTLTLLALVGVVAAGVVAYQRSPEVQARVWALLPAQLDPLGWIGLVSVCVIIVVTVYR